MQENTIILLSVFLSSVVLITVLLILLLSGRNKQANKHRQKENRTTPASHSPTLSDDMPDDPVELMALLEQWADQQKPEE